MSARRSAALAATVGLGIADYSSWLPWRARETRIRSLRELRLTRLEIGWLGLGIALILVAAYNEAVIGAA